MARGRHVRSHDTAHVPIRTRDWTVDPEAPTPPPTSDSALAGGADGHEYVPGHGAAHAARRRRRGPLFWAFLVVVLGALATVGVIGYWFLRQIDPPGPQGREVVVAVPAGVSEDQIATLLASKKIVSSAGAFRLYTRVRKTGSVRAGEYVLHERQSMPDVVSTLRRGPRVITYKVMIPEGFTLGQVAARVGKDVPGISEDAFLQAAASGKVRPRYAPETLPSMEGFLFPDTYLMDKTEAQKPAGPDKLLAKMVNQFDAVGAQVGIDKVPNVTPYEVLVVASLVEREAKVPEDRPQVARVIYNRLNKKMPLQIDASLLYGKPKGTKLTSSDLKTDGPYNTYTRKGLPPTPICNPGKAALDAAAHPSAGTALYYVLVDASGRHAFTDNYQEFLRLKKEAKNKGLL